MEIMTGFLEKKAIFFENREADYRLVSAIKKLPYSNDGVELKVQITGGSSQAYELWIEKAEIRIRAAESVGAFYAIQTLRQIFMHDKVPCLYIKDKPDFEYRGFYQDVTRGKIPTVATIKNLIDRMAYFKLNSLQIYVEYAFEFEECKELNETLGYLSKEEIRELDAYCKDNFIEFIPSLATFGHMYDLLQQDEYKHLRVLKDYEEIPNVWHSRTYHHTIDPLNEESIRLIKSLVDQFSPLFESENFNICCDETFDLKQYGEQGFDVGELYSDFVTQIITHLQKKGKKVMMWADVLLEHPEVIEKLPKEVCLLHWSYKENPTEDKIRRLAQMERKLIVCSGTTTWERLCEHVDTEEKNISRIAEYAYRHGASGLLNTNWGDYGNPCSLELAMYGMVLGAAKAWAPQMDLNEDFYQAVNFLLYESEHGVQFLKQLSKLHEGISWKAFCRNYYNYRFESQEKYEEVTEKDIEEIQNTYSRLAEQLLEEKWIQDDYRQEMLSSAEGLCVLAELSEKMKSHDLKRMTNTRKWLEQYRKNWMLKNKPSELWRIEDMLLYCEEEWEYLPQKDDCICSTIKEKKGGRL